MKRRLNQKVQFFLLLTRLVLPVSALLFFDQASKFWISANASLPIYLNSWFSFTYEKNIGVAFSIAIPFNLLLTLNILLFSFLIYFLLNHLDWKSKLFSPICSMFIAGALGNLADRLRLGYVVDFISVGSFPVFNLADSYITVSVFLLLLFYDKIKRPNKV